MLKFVKGLACREDEDNPLLPAHRHQVAQVIMDFPDMFTERPGKSKGWEHQINTHTLNTVVRTPIHPVPLAMQKMLQQEVEKML